MGNGKEWARFADQWQMVTLAASLLALVGCHGSLKPVAVTSGDMCAHCRMAVSDAHFAAQVIVAGEEPRIFDDIGCLAAALEKDPPPEGAAAFVADHRTGEWVPVSSAVFSRVPALETPMGSHIVAHANDASRAADPLASGGTRLARESVFRTTPGGVR